jgi:hypothetical protein
MILITEQTAEGNWSVLKFASICRGYLLWRRPTRGGFRHLSQDGRIPRECLSHHVPRVALDLLQAAEDALHRVYLTRTPNHLIQLPSSTFPLGLGDVFRQGPDVKENPYTAPELTMAEIMYASSGKSSVLASRTPVSA